MRDPFRQPAEDLSPAASGSGMSDERLAELEEYAAALAPLAPVADDTARFVSDAYITDIPELVAEVRRGRQERAYLRDEHPHSAVNFMKLQRAERERDDARAQVARLEEELVGVRSTINRVRARCIEFRDAPQPDPEPCDDADEGYCHYDARRATAVDLLRVLDGGGES